MMWTPAVSEVVLTLAVWRALGCAAVEHYTAADVYFWEMGGCA